MVIKKKVPLYLMMLIVALPQLSETIYTPSLPSIAAAFATTATIIEHTLTMYLIGFACGVFFWGTLSDRIGRKPGLYAGLCVYACASIGCYYTNALWALMLMRFMQAFGASTGSVLGQAVARDSTALEDRGKLFSTISIALAFAPAVGPVIGTALTALAGWRVIFLFLTLFAIFLALLLHAKMPETHPGLTHQSGLIRRVATCALAMIYDRRLLMSGVMIGGVNGLLFGYFAESPFYFKTILGFSDYAFGLLSLTVMIPLFAGSLISRLLNHQRFPSGRIIACGIAFIFSGGSMLLVLSICSWLAPAVLGFMSIALISVSMTGVTMVIPNVLGHALEPYKQFAGTAASLFGLYYYALIAFFTAIMALLHNGTVHQLPLFFVLIASCLCAAFFIGRFQDN